MNKRHKDFPLNTPDFTHRVLGLGVFAPVTIFFDAFANAFGCVALLFGAAFIGVDDLSNAFKKGANFWLCSGGVDPITGRFRIL